MRSASKYGCLISVRRNARNIHDLLNQIVAKFGKSIEWHRRTGYHNIKPHKGTKLIYFRFRGNQYVKKLELLTYDLAVLGAIKTTFPDSFKAGVEEKEGWL